MTRRQLTNRHIGIIPTVPTDRFEHPDTTPTRHSGLPHARRRITVDQRGGGARSDRHNRPGVSHPGPDRTVTVGPNQSVISTQLLLLIDGVAGRVVVQGSDAASEAVADATRVAALLIDAASPSA